MNTKNACRDKQITEPTFIGTIDLRLSSLAHAHNIICVPGLDDTGTGSLHFAASHSHTWTYDASGTLGGLSDSEARFNSLSRVMVDGEAGIELIDCPQFGGRSGYDGSLGISAILSGRAWNAAPGQPVTLAYHFAEASGLPDYYNTASPAVWRDDFTPFDEAQREAARNALAAWAQVGGIRFEEVEDPAHAQIVLGIADLPGEAAGYAFYPGAREGGDVWIDRKAAAELTPGGPGYATLLHEIGHALGLRHPDNVASSKELVLGGPGNPTLMSWHPGPGDAVPTEPGSADIEALRFLYGDVAPAADALPVIHDLTAQGAFNTLSNPYDIPIDSGWWTWDIDFTGDVDYWRFFAQPGYIYTVTADDDNVTSEVSPDIRLLTQSGFDTGIGDADTYTADFSFSVTTSAYYIVSIQDWDFDGFGTVDSDRDVGHYRFQVTSEPDLSITYPPDFDRAYWDLDYAYDEDLVYLYADFDGLIDLHDVEFHIYEWSGGDPYDIYETSVYAVGDGYFASAIWTARHQDDINGVGDPEYYFDVYVDGVYVGTSGTDRLQVYDIAPEFLEAYWNPNDAVDGDLVFLSVDFSASVNDYDVELYIYEYSGGGSNDIYQTYVDASEFSSFASGSWIALHQPDYFGIGDPEYYFDVYLDGVFVGTSDLLDVSALGGRPDVAYPYWSANSAADGELVRLYSEFSGAVGNFDVDFVIYEWSGGGSYDIYQTTISANVVGDLFAEAYWTALHQLDVNGIGDPEYYFEVYLDGIYAGESDLLEVNASDIRPDVLLAYWEPRIAVDGDLVFLNAEFSDPVENQIVEFDIYEYSGGGSYDIYQTTIAANEIGSFAWADWTAQHQPDYFGLSDPEYYFEIYVDGVYAGESGLFDFELLEVSASDATPEFALAYWDHSLASDGDMVYLVADFIGLGSLESYDVEFDVYEYSGGGYYDIYQTTIDATEFSSFAEANWAAVHQFDYYGIGDPEYYFDVYLDGQYVGSSDLLYVSSDLPQFEYADWSVDSALGGEPVSLSAEFSSSVEGYDVQFVIYEYSGGGYYDIYQATLEAFEFQTTADDLWQALHQPDYNGVGDPEYYFDVFLDGVYVGTSDFLNVTISTGPITPPEDGALSHEEIARYLTDGYWEDSNWHRSHFDAQPGDLMYVNWQSLNIDGLILAQEALAAWSAYSGLNFVGTTRDDAHITFYDDMDGAFAYSEESGGFITRSVVNVSTDWLNAYGNDLSSYSYQTYIHEVGHALGLGHGGNYNGGATYGINNHYLNDSWQATTMSYFSQSENTHVNDSYAFAVTPMVSDIIAIHDLYGTPQDAYDGNTTWGSNYRSEIPVSLVIGATLADNTALAATIYDTSGYDILDLSPSTANQKIDLRAEVADSDEQFASDVMGWMGNLLIAPGTVIEEAIGGTGDDEIIGNDADNRLEGGDGDDRLMGRGGNDELHGGDGEDRAVYRGSMSDYTIVFATTLGTATTVTDSTASRDGTDELYGIESLVFEGDGTEVQLNDPAAAAAEQVVRLAAADVVSQIIRPGIEASDSQAAEPDNDGTFRVVLNAPADEAIVLHFTVSGTAEEGIDYDSLGGQVTLQAGEQSAEIAVAVRDDNEREGNETVEVTLTHATGAGADDVDIASGTSATIVIADNEAPPPQVGLIYRVTRLPAETDTTAPVPVADIELRNAGSGPRGLELTGADAALFEMNADQTVLSLKAGATLDFASNPVLDVTVRVASVPDISASLEIYVSMPVEQEPPPPPSPTLFVNGTAEDNVVTLGSSLDTRANGSAGADHYVVLPGQTGQVSIEDISGNNVLLLDDGVEVASARLVRGTLLIDLAGGVNEEIEVLAATAYSYTVGTQTGLDWQGFLALVENGHTVSGTVPTPAITASSGSLKVFANGNPSADTFAFGYDLEVRSNGGAGDDIYRVTRFQTNDAEISDVSGTNLVRFEEGVEVTAFQNLRGTFVFTLANGATIQVGAAFGNQYQVAEGVVMSALDFLAWVEAQSGAFTASVATNNGESTFFEALEFASDDGPNDSGQPILEMVDIAIPQDLYNPDTGTFDDVSAFATAFGDDHALAFG